MFFVGLIYFPQLHGLHKHIGLHGQEPVTLLATNRPPVAKTIPNKNGNIAFFIFMSSNVVDVYIIPFIPNPL